MTDTDEREVLLAEAATELDIPPHKYNEALERFSAIKRHLEAGSFPGCTEPPDVYLQGSFRYGTVVRPLRQGADRDFDIDLVCCLSHEKATTPPKKVKAQVGAEVKAYASRNSMKAPGEGRRCWSLNYAPDTAGIGFHVDLLPCVPDPISGQLIDRLNRGNVATSWAYTQSVIAITHCEEPGASDFCWRSSNPIGFAKWFSAISEQGLAHARGGEQKAALFERYRDQPGFRFERIDEIPDALVRTPLQRAIQILKRHRDLRFSGRPNEAYKPITMIITTLAARVYQARTRDLPSTLATLEYIVEMLVQHAPLLEREAATRFLNEDLARLGLIQRRGNRWYIPNPVNPHLPGDDDEKGENFADRWHEDDSSRARAFFSWIQTLGADLDALVKSSPSRTERCLARLVGGHVSQRTLGRRGSRTATTGSGIATARSGSRFDVAHRESPRWAGHPSLEVKILGRAVRNGDVVQESTERLQSLPKGLSLEFEAQPKVFPPFDVYWQVVNTGAEAEAKGGLRGNIFPGGVTRTESTSYSGFHWIECFIVKAGRLAARSGEFVVEIS